MNTFHKDAGDVIDLAHVSLVNNYSFSGCLSTNVINTDAVSSCSEHAFDGSIFEEKSKTEDVVMAGSILAYVNPDADTLYFPSNITCVRKNLLDSLVLNTVVVEDTKVLKYLIHVSLIKKLVIKNIPDDGLSFGFLKTLHRIKALELSFDDKDFTSIDGVVYSKDRKKLFVYPKLGGTEFSVPEGIEYICKFAFCDCDICSVSFPDSLRRIGAGAFYRSNIQHVNLGNGLTHLESEGPNVPSFGIFDGCTSLEHVEIPQQITSIGKHTFRGSGLKSIVFHEGLQSIGTAAFGNCTSLSQVSIPASVSAIQRGNFGYAKDIYLSGMVKNPSYWMLNRGASNVTAFHFNDKVFYLSDNFNSNKELLGFLAKQNFDAVIENQLSFTKNSDIKQYLALQIYKENADNNKCKAYLKRVSLNIATKMLNKNANEQLAWFLSQDFLSQASLKKLLSLSENSGNTIASSYIADAMNRNFKKTSFQL